MKKIETRIVEYYGVDIEIPASHNFVATDESGDVYSYADRPELSIDDTTWLLNTPNESNYALHPFATNGCDWEESLREYPSLKPSYPEPKSERAKQFAEWFDAKFKIEDLGGTFFNPADPKTVLNRVKHRANNGVGMTNAEVRAAVIKHIDEYTVPQYGDYPHDNVEKWSKQYCIDMVGKYKAREGTTQRSEGSLDYWKMMHYSQLADCKPASRSEESMIAELLLTFKAVTSLFTPDGVLTISGIDAKGEWHKMEFDYRDWLQSGQPEIQAKLELANRVVQWVKELKE